MPGEPAPASAAPDAPDKYYPGLVHPDAVTAVMVVDGWSTSCSACRKSTAWTPEGHTTILGYGDENGSPGCGATWAGVSFVYGWPDPWPDHMPTWIADLPKSGVMR